MKLLAKLFGDLKAVHEGEETLLDRTMILYGSNLGDANAHSTTNLPTLFAGGGFRAGYIHGETDEFGHKAIRDVVTHSDYHATLLHLFGLDYQKLVFQRNLQEVSLVDKQPCKVIHSLLA